MNIKDITEETGWDLVEILKRVNSFPRVTETITEEELKNMTKEEFSDLLSGNNKKIGIEE
ncbi:hypothetical protein BU586_12535 [Staphylococcus agnetis]|uniref:hypothetical protein n=1 Tax=Staphylococcus agnetis TaxID=985762 RepID=UPI000D19F63F|nr:hypothetical protein [Staphylococcus agnetis]MCO4357977.1 hypothetical protein [Staphylococcus agnetis]MCO4363329.1 hypothetical protein [Staphylococcus agnetis]NJH79284.1 hypothetical protein [Staphylococcus agnetis]NJI13694.1 hypothetical protein [Staphylococcus agnetis]PTH15914.1 hypothetical protein BU591_01100 [Staphylococcus agnetis]